MICQYCDSLDVYESWQKQTFFSSKSLPCSYMPDGSQKYVCFECYRHHAGSTLEPTEYREKRLERKNDTI